MFSNLVKSFKGGRIGAKAIHVLSNTYNLTVSHPEQLNMMKNLSASFGQVFNEHEMAVHFLGRFASTIKIDHPKAKNEIEKYIRMSKGAYNRGLIENEVAMEELFKVAKERFNINPDDIDAA